MPDYPGISFSDVTFSYNEGSLLQKLSFVVKPGQHIIIPGDSEVGKSALLKLLLGFYLPDEETISLQNNH